MKEVDFLSKSYQGKGLESKTIRKKEEVSESNGLIICQHKQTSGDASRNALLERTRKGCDELLALSELTAFLSESGEEGNEYCLDIPVKATSC